MTRLIYLVGLRGTGKSTTGRLLAARLQLPFADADLEIERRAGCSIRSIFSTLGEQSFRDLEESVLAGFSKRGEGVIATGGGAVIRDENRRRMKETGRVIWLTASPECLWNRMRTDPATQSRRPDLSGGGLDEITQLAAAREALYRSCADLVIDTERRSPSEVVEAILESCSTSS